MRWRFPYILALLFFPLPLAAQRHFDTVLKGGHVVDPRNAIDAVMDVGILDQKIAAVEKNIAPSAADKVIDVSGLIVAPGLVDIHTHVYAENVSDEAGVAYVCRCDVSTNGDNVAGSSDIASSVATQSDIPTAGAAEPERQITKGRVVVACGIVDQSLVTRSRVAVPIADI